MKTARIPVLSLAALLCAASATFAQGPGGQEGPPGMDGGLVKLFGDVKTFTATAEIRTKDSAGKETMSLTGMSFSVLDGQARVEMDMSKVKSSQMPEGMAAGMKQMGLDRLVTLTQPKKKSVCMMYPSLQASADLPLPADTSNDPEDYKTETTKIGNETLNAQECVKNKVIISDAKGGKRVAFVWNAKALKDFPIQIQLDQDGQTMMMQFKDVRFEKPDAKQFEVPAGYTRYDSFQSLMQGAMMKMMGGAAGAK